jgi:ketosteroid isomerase-like protein
MDDAEIRRNLEVVEAHFDSEAAQNMDWVLATYVDDIVWEAPARHVAYRGKQAVAAAYLRLWHSVGDVEIIHHERWATEDRVFDDLTVTFTIVGDGYDNCPVPLGTRVQQRLLHKFEIRDGLIARETGLRVVEPHQRGHGAGGPGRSRSSVGSALDGSRAVRRTD